MEIKSYFHAQYNQYASGDNPRFDFSFHGCDMSSYGYICISEQTWDLPVPSEKELVLAQVKVLKAKEMKLQAEAYQACEQVREEIQKLLAIEDKSEAQDVVVEVASSDEIPF